jgi:hypothetical protein
LERSASLLSESARAQRTIEVQKFRVDIQRMIEDAQAELTGIQRDAENAFVIKFKPAVAKVAQDMGFEIVFNVDEGLVVVRPVPGHHAPGRQADRRKMSA